jgi:hypothetical protein
MPGTDHVILWINGRFDDGFASSPTARALAPWEER